MSGHSQPSLGNILLTLILPYTYYSSNYIPKLYGRPFQLGWTLQCAKSDAYAVLVLKLQQDLCNYCLHTFFLNPAVISSPEGCSYFLDVFIFGSNTSCLACSFFTLNSLL
jgi:hypothetical protein